jgi:hypothetical protein
MARKPKISVTCDCGHVERLDYGADYTCECGKRYSTTGIPEDEYEAFVRLDRRYRRAGQVIGSFFALLFGLVALTQPFLLMALVPMTLFGWMIYGRPIVRKRYWRSVRELSLTWNIKPEPGRPAGGSR